MKGIIVATLISCALALKWDTELKSKDLENKDLKSMFKDWASHFGKQYPEIDEESHRYGIWLDNLYKIAQSNDQKLSYSLRMNQFGDLTTDEFRHYVGGASGSCLSVPDRMRDKKYTAQQQEHLQANPSSVDWTTKGVVTPVKNQGNCGSCWSFSATGSMECDYAIKYGTLTSLSEQQLVDCSVPYGNLACDGGWYYNAWDYAYADGGLCTESAYPYTATKGTCKDTTCGKKYDVMAASIDTKITADSDSALETAAAAGCVSVAIEADQFAFQYYSSGVLTGTCGTNIDHAVLVVGYGTSGTQQYWKVKNSWGTSWGEQGYVLICRNCNANGAQGECGINMYPYVPNY